MINEVDSDTNGTDTLEFVELYDGGTGGTSLNGLIVVFYDGATDTSYAAYSLNGHSTNPQGYFTLGNNLVMGRDLIFPDNTLQNGADAVALYVGAINSFPNGTPVTLAGLVDAVVYDTADADDHGLLILLNGGQPQVDENSTGNSATGSIQRCLNGTGGLRNTFSYQVFVPTNDRFNSCGQVNTPPGANIVAGAPGGNASASFSMVTSAGETTFVPIVQPSGVGMPPTDYVIVNTAPAYDISTTATVVSPIDVCFTMASVNDPAEFSRVRLLHLEGGVLVDRTIRIPDSPALDFASRTVCSRVTSLSPFVTALAPPLTVSGRVTTPGGQGLRNAAVIMTDPQGVTRLATTSSFGIFGFDNVPADVTYIFSVRSKRYRFSPRIVTVTNSLNLVDFVGLE